MRKEDELMSANKTVPLFGYDIEKTVDFHFLHFLGNVQNESPLRFNIVTKRWHNIICIHRNLDINVLVIY